jgi:uracil-DNA glycosylase family 4
MKRYGEGRKGILLVGSHPNDKDDRRGYTFAGKDGQLLRKHLRSLGIDLEKDCVRTSAVACTRKNKPTVEQIKACSKHLMRDISEVQPKVIVCLGDVAVKALLVKPRALAKSIKGALTASIMHGLSISSKKYGCWVTSSYAPEFFLNRIDDKYVPDDQNLLLFDLASALGQIDKPLAEPLGEDGHHFIDNLEEAIRVIRHYTGTGFPVAYDYETNRLTPWSKKAKVASLSFTNKIGEAKFIPLNFRNPRTGSPYFTMEEVEQIKGVWRDFLESSTPKIVQNLNMEGTWDRVYFKADTKNWLHDTMLGAHVLYCRRSVCSLAFQVYHMVGHDYKSMVDTKDIMSSHIEDLFHYNCWDSQYTLMAYYFQKPRLQNEGRLQEFFEFMFRGEKALLTLTCRGIPIDTHVLAKMQKEYQKEQDEVIEFIRSLPVVVNYMRSSKSKEDFNLASGTQIAAILKNVFKIVPTKENGLPITAKSKQLCTDKDALPIIFEKVDDPRVKEFLEPILRFRKCESIVKRAKNYWVNMDEDNKVHPCYYLLLNTFRSSSEDPNIQNVFKHDKELIKFRRCIVPSPGRIWMEVDESSLEVRCVAMASGDEELIRQIKAGVDPHRKWAALIFQKPESEITKEERFLAKNGFVFLSFYGGTWQAAARRFPGVPREHIRDIHKQFWKEFRGVKEWQNRTIETYRKLGYVEAMSGFRRYAPLNINKLYNTPIQGPGFHLLLNTLVELDLNTEGLTAILDEMGFESKPLFEIHDSLTFDTIPEEAYDLHTVVSENMTKHFFDWQREIPMKVDWDVGKNWYDMYSLKGESPELMVHISKDVKMSLKDFYTV